MTQLSIGQAARLTGKSKSTVSRAIKNGRLSATRDGDRYMIDPAELSRVFDFKSGAQPLATGAQPVPQNDAQPRHATPDAARTDAQAALETEVRMLREMLDRERETVDDLRQRLTRAQALIEDRSDPPRPRWRWPWR